jgi:hypothetical protein
VEKNFRRDSGSDPFDLGKRANPLQKCQESQ